MHFNRAQSFERVELKWMLLNIRAPHLSNLTSITASPRLSSHMSGFRLPQSATSNHSHSSVVFSTAVNDSQCKDTWILWRCYSATIDICTYLLALKKKSLLVLLKPTTYTSAQSEICMPVFISFKAPPAQMASCPPPHPPALSFKQWGCCSLWSQLPQTAPWLRWKMNISLRTDWKSDESCY